MERFGLGYEAVREVNPQVIYLAMSMQGDDGPARNYLGYGITIGALTGFQHLTVDPAGSRSEPTPTIRTTSRTPPMPRSRSWPPCGTGAGPARGSTSIWPRLSPRSPFSVPR